MFYSPGTDYLLGAVRRCLDGGMTLVSVFLRMLLSMTLSKNGDDLISLGFDIAGELVLAGFAELYYFGYYMNMVGWTRKRIVYN
ncbi:hypothetical protein BpHYR1_052932 [Brachionus plicatilis]|uniref:Uncharacterized protein n=1 Tax=Brachionus plicatilis TaxID=10195 RepID=A0A3M7P5T7_BRAPC|nr:hypothetical protein BpHYR1_052932 [Brachionus plicatilis]